MRAIHSFTRSQEETTASLCRIFSSGGTARDQLALQAEMLVEPVGWDALWKLSKDFCKKFEVRFPCVACITVTSVDFEALTASVDVLSVQHELVTLPEAVVDVPLLELWPTVKQREQCVDAEVTAEFIDLMRFFYNNIWMPWDEQDDKVLLSNTIEDRMQLWAEIQNGSLPDPIVHEIVLLRNSAIDCHERLKELDLSLCDDQDGDEDDSLLPANYLTVCAELTAKLDSHMAKWPLYEKSLIRHQYLAKQKSQWEKCKNNKNVVVLWKGGPLASLTKICQQLTPTVDPQHQLSVSESVEHALSVRPEQLLVCSPHWEWPECTLANTTLSSIDGATLSSSGMRSCLLMCGSNCDVSDLTLRCDDVSATLVARAGSLTVRRCRLIEGSDKQGDFAQGIVAMADSKVIIEDTTFDNFYTGIVVHSGAQVELVNCSLSNCGVGVHMLGSARLRLRNTSILACREHCVRADRGHAHSIEGLHIDPDCTIGSGDLKKEILIVHQDMDLD